jgi:CxxC motif-containing protein
MKKEYTCIVCPQSCSLTVTAENGDITVTGNKCKRGAEYGRNEHVAPKRMITTTVALKNGTIRTVPVISSDAVPKEKLFACLEYLYGLEVEAPVALHDVIVTDILGTGVSILAARDAERAE